MLRDGKFIKEPPIVIGSHYVRQYHKDKDVSEEEQVMQNVLLDSKTKIEIDVEKCLLYMFLAYAVLHTIIYLTT